MTDGARDATGTLGPTPSPTLSLGGFLPWQLSVAAEAVSRAFAAHYERRFGISIPEWRVVATLGEAGAGEPARTTRDVIARTRMDRVKVSRAAISLEAKGLVHRAARPGDARAHELRLSPAGRALYARIVPLAAALQAELVAALGEAEREALRRALGRLTACADAMRPANGEGGDG